MERLSQHSRYAPPILVRLCEASLLEAKNIGRRWFICETDWQERMAGDDIAAFAHSLERLQKFRAVLTTLVSFLFLVSVFFLGFDLKFSLPPPSSRLGASLADSVGAFNKYWSERFSVLAHELPDNWLFLQERIIANWQHFLGAVEPSPTAPATVLAPVQMPASLEPALAQAIERYIEQQIEAQLAGRGLRLTPPLAGPPKAGSAGGLVAVPASGDKLRDEEVRVRLQEAFSDRVTVKFDSSGTSGVITPIFQNVPASEYLFVLTPLKQR